MSLTEIKDYFESWNKSSFLGQTIDEFNKQAKQSWDKFVGILDAALKDAGGRTIEVEVGGDEEASFKTVIKLEGDVTNEFPAERPSENDVYWKRHKELVDEILATRKEIYLKVIETVGNTVKGVINPFTVSNVDLAKIIQDALHKK